MKCCFEEPSWLPFLFSFYTKCVIEIQTWCLIWLWKSDSFCLQPASPYIFFFWESRDLQVLKTRQKLGCLETVWEVFCRCKNNSCSFPGLQKENSSNRSTKCKQRNCTTFKVRDPGLKSWHRNLKHWELVCRITVGLWEKTLGECVWEEL